MIQTNLGFMLANRELITKLFMVRKTLVLNTLEKLYFVNISTKASVFPVSPTFYIVNPLIGPLGACFFQAHEIRGGGLG